MSLAIPIVLAAYTFFTFGFIFYAAASRRRKLYFTQAEYLASLPPEAFESSDEVEVEKDCVT